MELLIYSLLFIVTVSFQWKLLKHVSLGQKCLGLLLVILIALTLLPPILGWQKQREVSHKDQYLGWVLWDRSASFKDEHKAKEELQKKLEKSKVGDIEWIEFSDDLLPPMGEGQALGGSDLTNSLKMIAEEWELQAPDWLWVVSDGAFVSEVNVPESIQNETLFYSQINRTPEALDYGLSTMAGDPVWYTRTESVLRVSVYRNKGEGEDEVDLICRLNGEMVATTKASFANGETEVMAEFTVSSDRLGPVYVEMMFAEGQGGAKTENDHLLETAQVIRDSVRVLRVVGRPSWSSKFLRDQLVKREDVDLIDFHILRSIRDRTMASTEELALIPFPVEELFVENLNSFDLIIWQNFDYENYPFFKSLYLRNIVRYVQNGGSLLLWAGTQPWQLETGIISELAPLSNKGKVSELLAGDFNVPVTSLLPDSFKQLLEPLKIKELRLFPGKLSSEAQVHLSYADTPLMLSRKFGRGRVLQMASDEFWNVSFQGDDSANDLYAQLMKQSLLWLQHHPDAESRELKIAERVNVGTQLNLDLPSKVETGLLTWEGVSLESQVQQTLDLKKRVQTTDVPQRPGVYELRLEDSKIAHRIGVGHPSGEYVNPEGLVDVPKKMKGLGFEVLEIQSELPKPKGELKPLMRTTGNPWHSNWFYFAGAVILLILHWIFLNRSLKISV